MSQARGQRRLVGLPRAGAAPRCRRPGPRSTAALAAESRSTWCRK